MPGRISALVLAGLLALVAVGCGGGDTAAMQVPGPPADVSIPVSDTPPAEAASSQDSGSSSDSSSSDSSSSDSSTTDSTGDTTTGDTGTSTDTGTGTTTDSGGGTAAPDTSQDSATNDTPPPDGSDAQQFEDFCAQNPGAC